MNKPKKYELTQVEKNYINAVWDCWFHPKTQILKQLLAKRNEREQRNKEK